MKLSSGNVVLGHQDGPNTVKFKDGDEITFRYCNGAISGLLFGKRLVYFKDKITVEDKKNDFYCEMMLGKSSDDGKLNPITYASSHI